MPPSALISSAASRAPFQANAPYLELAPLWGLTIPTLIVPLAVCGSCAKVLDEAMTPAITTIARAITAGSLVRDRCITDTPLDGLPSSVKIPTPKNHHK